MLASRTGAGHGSYGCAGDVSYDRVTENHVRGRCVSLPAQAQRYAEAYFGDWRCGADSVRAARAAAHETSARAPGAVGREPRFERPERAGPAALLGYYRPGMGHPDAVAYDVIRCAPIRRYPRS